jgi:Sulfotransferase family
MAAPHPHFMLGCQSSGTTILARIMKMHSGSSFGVEDGIVRNLIIWLWWMRGKGQALKYARFGDIATIMESLRPDKVDTVRRLRMLLDQSLRDPAFQNLLEKGAVVATIRYLTSRFYLSPKDTHLWGDKYPEYVFQLDEIHEIFPEARYIFVVRNPVSVTDSLIKRRFVAIGEKQGKMNLNEYRLNRTDCWHQWTSWNERIVQFMQKREPSRYRMIRYEDLLHDRTSCIEMLSNFVNIDLANDPGSSKVIAALRTERAFDVTSETFDQIKRLSANFSHPLCVDFGYTDSFYSSLVLGEDSAAVQFSRKGG